ncbi:MAG: hypothetical protein AAGF11_27265 [Myxococcota bacterium]
MSKYRLLLSSLAATLLLAPAAQAAPDDVCVRQANGVPGMAVKHPEWWNGSLSESQRNVRWTGATAKTTGSGATPELADSRIIWDRPSNTVFFEFTVHADPSIDPTTDLLMFAVSNAAGDAPELYIQFQPLRGCFIPRNCTGAGRSINNIAIRYASATGSGTGLNWSALSPTNPSSDFTVQHPWVHLEEVDSAAGTSYDWTVSFGLEVPTASNGQIRPNLRTYANAVMTYVGTSLSAVELPILCNPPNEAAISDCLVFSSSNNVPLPDGLPTDNLSLWPVVTSSDPNSCEGIELMRPLVGSSYNVNPGSVPGTSIPYEMPGLQIPNTSGTSFRAGFLNNTSDALAAGSVTARFRIANWGLQFADWDEATWSQIGTATLDDSVAPGAYAGATGQGRLESNVWVPASSDLALENNHQCLHVQLESNTPGVRFTVDSVYRNMDIVNASVARRPADIDLGNRRLPKGHKKHKVHLLVRSNHMPSRDQCLKAKGKRYGCAKGGSLVLARRALSKKEKRFLTRGVESGRIKLSEQQLSSMLKQKKRKGKKAEQLPYYVVYGMVDTGQRINLPGAPGTRVMNNFSSYGYSIQHEGYPAQGWEHYMHGAAPVGKSGKVFQMNIPPKTVASVANTVRVLSKETKECKKPPKSTWAVYGLKKTEELEAEIKTGVGKGKASKVASVRVTDGQLGCEPPPLRLPCKAKDCREHSPVGYIEGSRYVGDWTAISRRGKATKRSVRKPSSRRPSSRRTGAKTPSGNKPAPRKPAKTTKPKPRTSTSSRRTTTR